MIKLDSKQRITLPDILANSWLKETYEDNSDSDDEEEKMDKEKDNNDLSDIQGNLNYVNVDNLFYYENYKNKLRYIDYCCITEDFNASIIDEEAIKVCENFGFPRHFMIKSLGRGDINHATACYFLLTSTS